jgi:hypothetical protein
MLFDRRGPTTRTFAQIKYETPIFQAGWTVRAAILRPQLADLNTMRPLVCCTAVWKPVCAHDCLKLIDRPATEGFVASSFQFLQLLDWPPASVQDVIARCRCAWNWKWFGGVPSG